MKMDKCINQIFLDTSEQSMSIPNGMSEWDFFPLAGSGYQIIQMWPFKFM